MFRCPWWLLVLGLMLAACTTPATHGASGTSSERVEGSALFPAAGASGALQEQAAVGGQVRLVGRTGQAAATEVRATVDGLGRFSFKPPAGAGLFIVDVTLGNRHVRSLLQLQGGHGASTIVTAASTLVTDRLLRSHLQLQGLNQATFDGIVAQARGMMVMSDVPDLASDAAIREGTDAFLNGHRVIEQQVEDLLASLAQLEGVADTGLLPSGAPTTIPSLIPTASPAPLYTPEPLPIPSQAPIGLTSLSILGDRLLDSAPFWMTTEGENMLWASCPASNSIVRLERSSPTWSARRPMSPLIGSAFMPAQLAANVPPANPAGATVWIGNQHPTGTKVAYCDVWGNLLGSVEIGPKPSALGIDAAPDAPHVWMGVNGDLSGKVVILDLKGTLTATGQTAPYPFRFQGWTYPDPVGATMWIATPRKIYRASAAALQEVNAGIGTAAGSTFAFNGRDGNGNANPDLDHDVVAMTLSPAGDLWVVLQDPGATQGVLLLLYDHTRGLLEPSQIQSFAISTPVTGLIVDPSRVNVRWVSTDNELIRFINGGLERSSPAQLLTATSSVLPNIRGLFVGTDPSFWVALDHPAKLVKVYP